MSGFLDSMDWGPAVEGDVVLGALAAARAAGDLQLMRFRHLDSEAVRTKSSRRDLVTDVDLESERLIAAKLAELRPGWTFEGEEQIPDAAGKSPHWIVDPIDGTVNFVHGLPLFCVSIALYQDERPLLGVVHAPVLGETFVAVTGAGAFSVQSDGALTQLRVSATDQLGEAVLATGFPYRRGELEHSNLENFSRFFYDVRGLRRMGSAALDLAFVAAGRLDGFWELHLSPYDVAAGALLVREAGGVVQDALGGQGWLRSGSIIATGPGLVDALAQRVVC